MQIKLSPDDIREAAKETTEQIIRKIGLGRNSDHGGVSVRRFGARFGNGVIGMLGQIAASRATGLAITSKGVAIDYADIAGVIEVRTTEHQDGHLLVYKDDADAKMVMHVTCEFPVFTLHVPILAGHAKSQRRWRPRADPPCFWVEASSLRPLESIEQLHAWVRRRLDDGSLTSSAAAKFAHHDIANRQSLG